jgi:hypothetical protein
MGTHGVKSFRIERYGEGAVKIRLYGFGDLWSGTRCDLRYLVQMKESYFRHFQMTK